MKSSVTFKNVRKVFRDAASGREAVAVQGFDLLVKEGELVTLLGPSGCGKTTLLRMLAGFETPTSGEILLNDRAITHVPPNQRNSAMVFQSYALFPHMNVEQNILYGLKLRGVNESQRREKLARFLEVVGLRGYEKRRPSELSGGQQQRVALARALIVEPAMLLFDEPLSNLDAKLRESMRVEIRSIQKKLGITSVYVTHDQAEAMAISDRVVVMNKGVLEQHGTPQEVYLQPKTAFVADFLGAANILGAVAAGSGRVRVGSYEFSCGSSAGKDLVAGQAAKVIVRPEQVMASQSQGIAAVIEDRSYLGAFYECRLKLETGESLLARFGAEDWPAILDSNQVRVRFREELIQVLS